MTKAVNNTPALVRPIYPISLQSLAQFDQLFMRSIFQELSDHAAAINAMLLGREPFQLARYTVATVPDATVHEAKLIYVTDETGGAVPAFSDGTDWRRVTDRNIVS